MARIELSDIAKDDRLIKQNVVKSTESEEYTKLVEDADKRINIEKSIKANVCVNSNNVIYD